MSTAASSGRTTTAVTVTAPSHQTAPRLGAWDTSPGGQVLCGEVQALAAAKIVASGFQTSKPAAWSGCGRWPGRRRHRHLPPHGGCTSTSSGISAKVREAYLYASEQAGFGKVPNEDVIDRFFDEAQVALSS